jgi:mannosyltransferase
MEFLLHHTILKFFAEGLWRDEAFSWAMATRGFHAVPLTARDYNPPLYYLLLYGWMTVAGPSEAAMRSLSLVFFAGTLWFAWRFMTDLLAIPGRRAGLYLALFALNPVLSYFAVEARMYSLLAFLATASFYAYQARRPILYVASTTAGLYTHYFMMLVVLTQIASALLFSDTYLTRRRRVLLLSAPVVLFLPWVVACVTLRGESSAAFWIDSPGWRFVVHLVTAVYTSYEPVYGFLDRQERWLFTLCLSPVVAWSLWAGYRWSERWTAFRLVALWALLPPALVFIGTFIEPLFLPRYLIFSTVGLLLLLVFGLERSAPHLRLVLLGVLCGLAVLYQVIQAHRYSKGEYRETVRQIALQAGSSDVLYVENTGDFFPAQYYFGEARVFVFGRRYDDIPPYMGKVLIPPGRVVPTMPQPPARVFVLRNHREYVRLATHAVVEFAPLGQKARAPSREPAGRPHGWVRREEPRAGSDVSRTRAVFVH